MLELNVEKREKLGSLKGLRSKGSMPAVLYGKKQESMPISISSIEFEKVWNKAGESSVVTLKEASGKMFDTLIQDVDFDPVSGKPRHADFYVFEKDHKLEVSVPLTFEGIAPGVKDHGGLLVKVLHELKIEAMPKDLPHEISVDISALTEIGSQLHARDLKLPSGVTLLENPEEAVVLVTLPKEEKEEEVVPVDLSSIEVEKKGKEKEGEETVGDVEAPVSDKGKQEK